MEKQILNFEYPIENCKVIWLSDAHLLEFGQPLMSFETTGSINYYYAPCRMTNIRFALKVGEYIRDENIICSYHSNSINYEEIKSMIDESVWNLAITTNAAIKGLMGSFGQSGQIAARTVAIHAELPVHNGIHDLLTVVVDEICKVEIEEGDVIVLAEKPFAVAQNRLVPISYIYESDPKKMTRESRLSLLEKISKLIDTPIEEEDLILADSWLEDPNNPQATMGAYDHNALSFQIAEKIETILKKKVDVIISDTDTGIDIRSTIIGCITIGATPLGATKGVNLYECMRAACAAEFTRGSTKRTPIVICKPATRCRLRPKIGDFRGYHGKLKLKYEGRITFA